MALRVGEVAEEFAGEHAGEPADGRLPQTFPEPTAWEMVGVCGTVLVGFVAVVWVAIALDLQF